MSRILAIDLGKFKSVTCLLDTATNQTEFWTMSTDRQYLLAVLKKYAPELVVIESCSLAGWVHSSASESQRSTGRGPRFPHFDLVTAIITGDLMKKTRSMREHHRHDR